MCGRWWIVGGTLAALVLGAGRTAPQAAEPEEAVFPMEEISVFEEAKRTEAEKAPYLHQALLSGQYAFCGSKPLKQVKKYPKLVSERPLYGSVKFGGSQIDPTAGIEFCFVIDESEPPKKEKVEEKPEKRSLLRSIVEAFTGRTESPSRPEKSNYDRLYFDADGDLDLTNDPVLKLMKDPPEAIAPRDGIGDYSRVFDYLSVPLDHGPGLGKRPFRIVPQLWAYGPGNATVTLLPAVARKGKIRIGREEYAALLTQSDTITGRFDSPYTKLLLTPVGAPPKRAFGWWSDWLCTMRRVDGQLYRISATPSGDKLTVGPYRGDSGVLEVGPGDRKIKKLGAAGVLAAKQQFVLPIGIMSYPLPGEKPARHELPVGDYQPIYLVVDYGRVALSLRANTYAADGSGDQAEKPPSYNIKVVKDKPYLLEFSKKPTVRFNSPPKDRTFKPGDNVPFEAVLIDPKLDLMISGLEDTSTETGKMEFRDEEGNPVSVPRYRSLDPTVAIKDSSGKEVASGKMPFG